MVPFATTRSKDSKQRLDLALPAVELLRDQQPVRHIVSAERERVDAAMRLPFRQAAPQIGRDAGGGLVALLGGLGEELHDDSRERRRDVRDPLARRRRLPGDMAVHPLHRIGSREGQRSRQHLVEGDAQRIEIAAGVRPSGSSCQFVPAPCRRVSRQSPRAARGLDARAADARQCRTPSARRRRLPRPPGYLPA